LSGDEAADESGDHISIQFTLELIGVADEGGELHSLQLNKSAQ
jgi:hypothetical protein